MLQNLQPRSKKTSANTSLAASPLAITGANDVQTIESAHERPAGKKKEKQILRQRATLEVMEYLVGKKGKQMLRKS
jgi:hypothetical protein